MEAQARALSPEKALAVAAYGESVAAYRYRTLAEKAPSQAARTVFVEMAEEEQGHHQMVQALLDKHFPESDFVLSGADKELVIVGPRMLDVRDRAAFEKSLKLIQESERLTGRFYAIAAKHSAVESLRPMFQEMADECFEHAARLDDIPPED